MRPHALHDELLKRHFVTIAADWPVLSSLLDELLDLPPTEREAWIEALTGERARLRVRLKQLMRTTGDGDTDGFLSQLPSLPNLSSGASRDSASAGALVGPYQLISELGRGGMGSVWLADRVDGQLKRQVALKLPRMVWDGSLAERLVRERDILASLTHPNIARLYDAGADAHGRPYLAMEVVDGSSIDKYCQARNAGVRERLELLLQVCAAVAHAHAQLVVHRDLKPGNILVTEQGQVRLLDFGIAKLLDGDRAQETQLTRISGRALSLDYASPEQIRGEPIGTASDVYSMGKVAYELLVGQLPYRLKRGSAAELEEAIMQTDPALASELAASPDLKRHLRGDLDSILNKALKKSPGDRYPTMVAFADDIQRHLDGRPVLARPESRSYLVRRFIGRHRAAVTALAAIVVALSVGLATALWQARVARLSELSAERSLAREGAVRMLAMETLSLVASASAQHQQSPATAAQTLRAKLEEYEVRFKDQPEQRLGLLEAVGVQLAVLGDYQGSLDVSRRYLALLKEARPDASRMLRAYLGISRALDNLQRSPEAATVLEEALAAVPDTPDSVDSRVSAMSDLSRTLKLLDRREEARHWLILAAQRSAEIKDGTSRWDARSSLAAFYFGFDDLLGLRLMRAAHDEYLADPRSRSMEKAQSFLFLGRELMNVGRPAEAERAFLETQKRYGEMFGAVDRDSVIALGRVATTVASQGRYGEANRMLAQRRLETVAQPGPDTAVALATLAALQLDAALMEGDITAAAQFAAMDVAASLPRDRAIFQLASARLLTGTGKSNEAIRYLQAILAARPPSRRWGIDTFALGVALAEARIASGDPSLALADLKQLTASMQTQQALRNANYRQARLLSALALSRMGDPTGGLTLLTASDRENDGLQPLSLANRADAAAIRAEVMHAAGRRADAAAALTEMKAALIGQHVDSPRWQPLRRLSALLNG